MSLSTQEYWSHIVLLCWCKLFRDGRNALGSLCLTLWACLRKQGKQLCHLKPVYRLSKFSDCGDTGGIYQNVYLGFLRADSDKLESCDHNAVTKIITIFCSAFRDLFLYHLVHIRYVLWLRPCEAIASTMLSWVVNRDFDAMPSYSRGDCTGSFFWNAFFGKVSERQRKHFFNVVCTSYSRPHTANTPAFIIACIVSVHLPRYNVVWCQSADFCFTFVHAGTWSSYISRKQHI